MNDIPGIEEVKNDIELTRKEAEAYQKLKEGYTTLGTLPELDDQTRITYIARSVHCGNLEKDCRNLLNKLINYQNKLEEQNGTTATA